MELGYRNIYYRANEQLLNPTGPAEIPGWYSTPATKLALLSEYRSALHNREYVNRSESALGEQGGEASPNDPSGARLNHGDQTIADALACKMSRGLLIKEKRRMLEPPLKPSALAWRRQFADNQRRLAEY